MRSNYKKIGPYIREVVEKNNDLAVDLLLGVSVSKEFIPSIANIIGTDMSTYKIVRKDQFAYGPVTSRNSDKVSVALLTVEECIVSTSYTVFEIIDHNTLLPEYLMMWFRRPEFDRYARFKSHGSVRELFDWEEMCDVELPMPSIEKQREIVKEYHTIVDRIKLNERLNQKLEETAQAIYRQWFVNFEFPISAEYAASIGKPELEGQPYKSSGGEMVFNEVLKQEIPVGWEDGSLECLADLIDGDRGSNYPCQEELLQEGHCLFLNTGNVTKKGFDFSSNNFVSETRDNLLRKGKLTRGDVVLTTRGTVGNSAYFSDVIEYEHIRINSGMIILRAKKRKSLPLYVFFVLKSRDMKHSIESFMSGSAQQHLPIKDIKQISVLIPKLGDVESFESRCGAIQNHLEKITKEIRKLYDLKDVFLCKISRI